MSTRITCEDTETGERESVVIEDDYVVITDGTCHVSNVQSHPVTHVITIKRPQKDAPLAPGGDA